jgi:hypothetical protein
MEPIYGLDKRDQERVLAWARYVYWADVECQQYEAYQPLDDEPTTGLSFVLMIQWYAALWVSIEAWRESGLTDFTVDELLTDSAFESNLRLLRRFRNGVYHYQASVLDNRLTGFIAGPSRKVPWAFLVHSEFKRVLWELSHPVDLPVDLQEQIAAGIRDVIGWLPTGIPEAAPYYAAHRFREVGEMILKAGRRDTQEAQALLDAVEKLRTAADQSSTGWTAHKRTMIESLKEAARDDRTT